MADLPALVTVKSIVEEALWLARKDQNEYMRFFTYAINCFRELNTFHIDNVKSEKLVMNSNNIIPFPTDMVRFIGIYVPINGKKVSLSLDSRMVNTTTIAYGVETRDEEDGENQPYVHDTTGFNAKIQNAYGSYFPDYRGRRFIFNTDYRSEVILDYTSSGVSSEDDLIPVYVKSAMVRYMMWQDAYFNDKASANDKAMKYELYKDSLRDLSTYNMPSIDELRDALNDSNSGVPQR